MWTAVDKTKAQWQLYYHAVLEKKVCKLVFKHLKQLVARTEPAEPLITVIYKPDSTLMGRQNLPSPSFLRSSSLLTSAHLLSRLTFSSPSFTLLPSLSFPFLLPLRPSYFLSVSLSARSLTHCFTILKVKREGREVRWAGEFPRTQRKNVFGFFFFFFCTTSQYSLRSGLGPRSSLGMAWDKAANNSSPSDRLGHS